MRQAITIGRLAFHAQQVVTRQFLGHAGECRRRVRAEAEHGSAGQAGDVLQAGQAEFRFSHGESGHPLPLQAVGIEKTRLDVNDVERGLRRRREVGNSLDLVEGPEGRHVLTGHEAGADQHDGLGPRHHSQQSHHVAELRQTHRGAAARIVDVLRHIHLNLLAARLSAGRPPGARGVV